MRIDAAINVRSPKPIFGAPTAFLDTANLETAGRFLDEYIHYPFQRCAVVGDSEAGDVGELIRFVAAHYRRVTIDAETLKARAITWGEYYLKTLRRRPRWATSATARPLAGLPVFVVAAGPSLDLNGFMLAQAHSRGPVFAVNTSLSACRYYGVEPDVVLCVESKDVSSMLSTPPLGLCVLDATAHPANWTAAGTCEGAIGIYSHEPSFIPYGMDLGVRPLNYGGSVACAAVALALYWGASQVVLVGQDLAFTGGKMYGRGTPFDDVTVTHEAGSGMLVFGGESKQLQPQPVVMRPAWGGGEVASGHGMDSFCQWFEKTAERHCLINATEGGVRIPGTLEIPLATVIAGLPKWPRGRPCTYAPNLSAAIAPVPDAAYEGVRTRLLAEAAAFTRSGNDMQAGPLLNMWGVPAILRARQQGLGFLESRALMREQLELGARTIAEAMS